MYSCSYGMRNLVLLICFTSYIVLCIGPYSCLLFRIHIAYACNSHQKTASLVPPEDGPLTPETCRELRHNKVIVKVKVY
jgi:hypothetical protein